MTVVVGNGAVLWDHFPSSGRGISKKQEMNFAGLMPCPHRLSFPRVLSGNPGFEGVDARQVHPRSAFKVLYSPKHLAPRAPPRRGGREKRGMTIILLSYFFQPQTVKGRMGENRKNPGSNRRDFYLLRTAVAGFTFRWRLPRLTWRFRCGPGITACSFPLPAWRAIPGRSRPLPGGWMQPHPALAGQSGRRALRRPR
jgi:hypothetical protein